MPATNFADMATLATPRTAPSPPFHRRRKSWARKLERCCCMTFTHIPLVFVYGLTTWAVYVQLDVCFLGRYDWLAFFKAGLAIVLYLLADVSYTMAVFTNPGSTLDLRSGSRRTGRRRKEGGYEDLPMQDEDDDEETADTAVPREWMSAVTAKSTGKPRYCKKCQAVKPDRAHHCSTCGRCVLKMDHHCPWLATCVGLRNYKAFLLFLTYVSLFCITCFASTALWVWEEIFSAHQMDSGLRVVNIIMLAVLSGIIGLVLSGFAGWHYYLTLTAQTTIESLEKTRYLTGLRKTLEPSPQPGQHHLGQSVGTADYEASAGEDQPLAERLKVIHANALPGVLRPEEGDVSAEPSPQPSRSNSIAPQTSTTHLQASAQGSLRRSFASLEAQRERDRYNMYLDERDSETMPNAFNHGWRRNFLHVFGDRPLLWPLPICTTSGDGWMWDVSAQWTAARDRLGREREERDRSNAMWDRHSGHTYRPPPQQGAGQTNWRWNGGAGFVDQYGNAPQLGATQQQPPARTPPPPSASQSASSAAEVQMLALDRRKAASPSPGGEDNHRQTTSGTAATANWNDIPEDLLTGGGSSRRSGVGSGGERGANHRRKGE